MPDHKPKHRQPRILILEGNEDLGNHALNLLEKQGWMVEYARVSKQALDLLKQSQKKPFHLFISSFKLPKMEGDDILKNARMISPMTRRMLMVPACHPDMIVRAIKKAEIHSCIIHPFSDQDLINQAAACLEQFSRLMKKNQLERITIHQNKQMFHIAQKLKKKGQLGQEQIQKKNLEILKLRSRLREAESRKKLTGDISLEDRIEQSEKGFTQKEFSRQFKILASHIQILFKNFSQQHKLNAAFPLPGEITVQADGIQGSEDNKAPAPPLPDQAEENLIRIMLQTAYNSKKVPEQILAPENQEQTTDPTPRKLSSYLSITLSQDQTRADIHWEKELENPEMLTLSNLLTLCKENQVSYGIIGDQAIESWIKTSKSRQTGLTIAMGVESVPPEDGLVKYLFETDYANPGKIMDDGRIDFRDRGEIPYVNQGDILAEKRQPVMGKPGITVSGDPIEVSEPEDPVFLADSGTQLSEDGLSIIAATSGQPWVDALGNVSVNPELMIDGDVDYETGNVDFNGNILIKGMIKEGFSVKGTNVTAEEIQGGQINIIGDLYISGGITDAVIESRGSVHAKFINNSAVDAFGSLIIQKEIIDSQILVSGACENHAGHIISSTINAKKGIEACNIGTESSPSSTLMVGMNTHIETHTHKIEESLNSLLSMRQDLKDEIKAISKSDRALYELITETAQAQEKAQNQVKKLKAARKDMQWAQETKAADQILSRIKGELKKSAEEEEKLNRIFETQHEYANQVESLSAQIDRLEEANKKHMLRKKAIREFALSTTALPRIQVQKAITQGTIIKSPNAALSLSADQTRCTIKEIRIEEEGISSYEMSISDT